MRSRPLTTQQPTADTMPTSISPCAVVFDMDGLMFNTEDVYTLVGTELLRRRGHEFTPKLKDSMMGLPPEPTFKVMIEWHDLDESWEQLAVESNRIFLDVLPEHLAPMPGLFGFLEALEAAGIRKAIATSSKRELADACLSPFDLQPRFQFILTSEDVTCGKPNPEIYLKAAEKLGLPPQQTLVLEDSEIGCRAAVASGAFAVAVPGEHSRTHDFSTASLVVDDLADPRLYEALGIGPR